MTKWITITLPLNGNYGEYLKKRRLAKGLDIAQLSLLSGVSASNIYRTEDNKRSPTFRTLLKLEKALQ